MSYVPRCRPPEADLISDDATDRPIRRGHLRRQSLEYEPEPGRQFEEPEAAIEPPQVYELGKVRRDDKGNGTHHGPRGDDHAEGGKSSGDVTRLEEQVAASRGCQTIEQQADVVGVKTGEIQPPQRCTVLCTMAISQEATFSVFNWNPGYRRVRYGRRLHR